VTAMLTPTRRRGVEILDLPDVDPEVVTRSLGDVARCNALFGGLSSALHEIRSTFNYLPQCATLPDPPYRFGEEDVGAIAGVLLQLTVMEIEIVKVVVVPVHRNGIQVRRWK